MRAFRHMGLSRPAYYQGQQRQAWRWHLAEQAIELVRDCLSGQPRLGTRKLHHLLRQPMQQAGIGMGCDLLQRPANLEQAWRMARESVQACDNEQPH